MKYLYNNRYWRLNNEYNIDKILYLLIDRPNENDYNSFIWLNDKEQLHRNYDFPSQVYQYEDKIHINLYWYKNNKQHRTNNKPAVITFDGYKRYYMNDKFIKDNW